MYTIISLLTTLTIFLKQLPFGENVQIPFHTVQPKSGDVSITELQCVPKNGFEVLENVKRPIQDYFVKILGLWQM